MSTTSPNATRIAGVQMEPKFGENAAKSVGLAQSEFNQLATPLGSILSHNGINQPLGPPPSASGFRAYYLLGFEPVVWGLIASFIGGVVGSLVTPPPDPARVSLMFDAQPPSAPAPATLDLHPELESEIA